MKAEQLASVLKTMFQHMEATGASSASIQLINTTTAETGVVVMIASGKAATEYLQAFQAVSAKHEMAGETVQ